MSSLSGLIGEKTKLKLLGGGITSLEYDQLVEVDYKLSQNSFDKLKDKYAETKPISSKYTDLTQNLLALKTEPSIFNFFIDGTRRIYHTGDRIVNRNLYPEVAGQVSVVCCKREDKRLKPHKSINYLMASLYEGVVTDNFTQETFKNELIQSYNEKIIKKFPFLKSFNNGELLKKIEFYKTAIDQDNLVSAKSKVQERMNLLELELLQSINSEENNNLNHESYLLKDGTIDYPFTTNSNFREYLNIKQSLKFVVGVSKTFNPDSNLHAKNTSYSEDILKLPKNCRTPVFSISNDRTKNILFIWYLRIRDRKKNAYHPFEGVIKCECLYTGNNTDGARIESDLVDLISTSLIKERNPTSYGTEDRWANHLYPIYLTEKYLKNNILSSNIITKIL